MRFSLSLLFALFLIESRAHAAAEIIQESTTHFRVSPLLSPVVTEALADSESLLTRNAAWSFGLGVEVPITNWMSSGFLIQFNTGLPGLVPVPDLSPIVKLQWPFRIFSTGNCAPYVLIPLGISYTTAPVVDEVAKRSSLDPAEATKLYDTGVGFNGALLGGFEFLPFRYLGGYIETGYKLSVLYHQIVKGPNQDRTWQFSHYWIRGFVVSFGAKVAF